MRLEDLRTLKNDVPNRVVEFLAFTHTTYCCFLFEMIYNPMLTMVLTKQPYVCEKIIALVDNAEYRDRRIRDVGYDCNKCEYRGICDVLGQLV